MDMRLVDVAGLLGAAQRRANAIDRKSKTSGKQVLV